MDESLIPQKESKQWIVVLIVFFVTLAVFGWFVFGNQLVSVPQNFITKEQANNSTQTFQNQIDIKVTSKGFEPQTITVKKGTTVNWINEDTKPHQIASDPHPTHANLPELNSGLPLGDDEVYTFTFDKTGEFTYHDHINPFKFKGTVIVQ